MRPIQFHTDLSEAQCRKLTDGLHFYHSFDLSNGLHIQGDWDISRDVGSYLLPDVADKTVLDMGPASGWFSFYLEQQGAQVTVLESRGYGDFDVYGVDRYTRPTTPPKRHINGRPVWYGPHTDSFWAMHEILGSRVKFVNGRFYEAPDVLDEQFDLVLANNILQHVRDPVGVLRAAHAVCRGTCIAAHQTWFEHDDSPYPVAQYPFFHIDRVSWAQPNRVLFDHWFKAAGFQSVDSDHYAMSTPDRENYNQGVLMNAPFKLRVARALA
jgi:SAM-dependent methyltransferase